MVSPQSRPAIPAAVKRQLRQEAGYGCCVCGHPIFEYQHIIPWSTEHHFRPEDMMLLCLNHHNQATQNVLSEADQRQAKKNPFNIQNGHARGQLFVQQTGVSIDLGGHKFQGAPGDLLRVDGETLIGLKQDSNGALLLDLKLYDENDNLLAEIVENEWQSNSPLPWDLEYSYQKLTIRNAPRRISLKLDCRSVPISIRGKIWGKGRLLRSDNSGLHVDGAHMIGGGTVNNAVIEMDSNTNGGFRMVPRSSGSLMIGSPVPYRNAEPKVGRNQPCPCGSGKKYKRCHGQP
jgi:hypothetical protein